VDLKTLDSLLDPCRLCPRECRAHRRTGQAGFCRSGTVPLVGSVGPHFGEEAVLVGRGGSGTIFLAGCSLGCRFCQNWGLSHLLDGEPVSLEDLARAMLALASRGCENINLVTPSHFAAPIAQAIALARRWGLAKPIVWNCGGYESVEALRCLDGLVDIYMPDLKTLGADFAARALLARDYPERARAALAEMQRQVGDLRTDARGVAERGLLVRHLVMPGRGADARACLEFLAREVSSRACVNVMGQYHPCGEAYEVGDLDRGPTGEEVSSAKAHARRLGLRLAAD
jgi:putative pyruvate formate lyase activating enzyme